MAAEHECCACMERSDIPLHMLLQRCEIPILDPAVRVPSSRLNRISALPRCALGRLDLQAHFLPQGTAEEPAHAVGLPFGGLHECLQCGAFVPLQQPQDYCCFTAHTRCRTRGCMLRRPDQLRRDRRRLYAVLRGKVLDGFPDTSCGNLAAREFPYGTYARQAVPDFDQAGS
jgi:hypothetical protein